MMLHQKSVGSEQCELDHVSNFLFFNEPVDLVE